MKKYLLMPGYIKSQTDGDQHYISPVQLKNLYNVPMSECLIYNERIASRIPENITILRPQFAGNYTLPKDNNE